jgi:hypothetical protein
MYNINHVFLVVVVFSIFKSKLAIYFYVHELANNVIKIHK